MIRLRWAFLFKGGREVYGGWNSMTPNAIDSPKCVDLNGLGHAVIQAKDQQNYQVRTLAACLAEDFVEYQTIALAPMKKVIGFRGRKILGSHFGGLRIVTKTGAIECYVNGQVKNIGD